MREIVQIRETKRPRASNRAPHERYYVAHRREVIAKAAANTRKNYLKDVAAREFPRKTFRGARDRALRRGLAFTITREELRVPVVCPAIGVPIDYRDKDHCASLERIDNEKGYVPGNVEVVSFRANAMKRNASLQELKNLVAWLERR